MTTDITPPSHAGVSAAAATLAPYITPTPLVRAEILSRAFDADVWLKNETVSPVASFKLRGGLNGVLRAKQDQGATGVVTSSTGNHGQGVAYAARLAGLEAHIFLAEPANPVKRAMIAAFGATVHEEGHDVDDAKDRAKLFAAANGHAFLDDGESLEVMEGAGTMGLEAAEALDGIDAVVVPMGSGTAISGCAAGIKGVQPDAKLYAVQSSGSPAMVESYHAGAPIERPIDTIADGLACRVPAARALNAIRALVDDAWLVDDAVILAGVHTLVESAHILVEPGAAAGFAAAWQRRETFRGKRVVFMLTGANITSEALRRALDTQPFFTAGEIAGA